MVGAGILKLKQFHLHGMTIDQTKSGTAWIAFLMQWTFFRSYVVDNRKLDIARNWLRFSPDMTTY